MLDLIDERTKIGLLGESFCACLHTHSPVKSLNETVELNMSMSGVNKIAKYMSKTETENSEPILIVKSKIKNSYAFRKLNN